MDKEELKFNLVGHKMRTPEPFPLAPTDAHGRELTVGAAVHVLSVKSCVSELPIKDQQRLNAIVDQTRHVIEFDRAGFVWLSFVATEARADFCLFPAELALA
jgi:hypothetical protein